MSFVWKFLGMALVATAVPFAGNALAQVYPTKPITLVATAAAGGTTDIAARLLAEPLSKALGQQVIVDNKPGANGGIGTGYVARANPDGYTLLMQYSGYQVITPHLVKTLGWDPIKSFAPVANVLSAPQVIVVRPSLPVKTLQELVAYAKANPGKLNYASSGNGSLQHVTGELLKQLAGIDMTHVPYKGASPAMLDLQAGRITLMATSIGSSAGMIKQGKIRAIGTTWNAMRLAAGR